MAEGRDWIVVSRGTTVRMLLVLAAIALPSGFLLAAAMMPLGYYLSGTPWTYWQGYAAGVALLTLLIGPIMLTRASRFLAVDPSGTRFRTRFRHHDVQVLRHAYRQPDSVTEGRFQLRLAIPGGPDAVLGISPQGGALSTGALDALIGLLEHAPIEPDPRFPVRPPLGDEHGERDESQLLSDAMSHELLGFEQMSFTKPTLLAELRTIRDRQLGRGVAIGDDLVDDLALRAPHSDVTPPSRSAVHREALTAEQMKATRGPFATMGAAWRAGFEAVDSWLVAVGTDPGPARGVRWWIGLALAVAAALAPLLACGILAIVLVPNPEAPQVLSTVIVYVVLLWPLLLWNGLQLMWADRVQRFTRTRDAVVRARLHGAPIPQPVAGFFGSPFPESALRSAQIWLHCCNGIALLAFGIMTIALSHTAIGPHQPAALAAPIGAAMVVASAFFFAWFYRAFTGGPAETLRATVLWRALSGRGATLADDAED